MAMRSEESGQGTVEAAFLVPVLFLGLLLLLQPGILLYDRIVMAGAASEACRLLATSTDTAGDMEQSCESYVLHRLSAVPQTECFHVHDGGCTWEVSLDGDEDSGTVSVSISTEVEPLPLLGAASSLLGIVNDDGNFTVTVSSEQQTQPDWVVDGQEDMDASEWVGAWKQ